MKQLIFYLFLAFLHVIVTNAGTNLVCYYNSASSSREGEAKLINPDLELALQFCTHLVYGYVGISGDKFEAHSLNSNLDITRNQFKEVTSLKKKYPHLKILLSVGGDHDIDSDHPDKYIDLLESRKDRQKAFIRSALTLLKTYDFDGLDLAYQFPKNKPRKVHGTLGSFFKQIKKTFTGDYVVDPKAAEHKEQFTALVHDVHHALSSDKFLLSLTVLPNVNSTWYFNIPGLVPYLDFVNLAAFDFLTPERNPEEADYTAPLVSNADTQNRLAHYSGEFQTKYWQEHGFPSNKINLGVSTYGNAWKLTEDSDADGKPVVAKTDGPAAEGPHSKKPGLLSYPEICVRVGNPEYTFVRNNETTLWQVSFGNYAYRLPKSSKTEGIWISYDDLNTVAYKAVYARAFLGGVALFDLGYDDFRGVCEEKYPLLRSIKYRFDNLDLKIGNLFQ